MNSFVKYLVSCLVGIFVGVVCVLWCQLMKKQCEEINDEVASVVWRQNHFLLCEENLMNELKAQDVKFPEIVAAQALLETGHFKSYSCTNRNNLFGLRKRDGTYMSFEHWTECVAAYKKYIQKWQTPPKDYYVYLDKLGYAEDKSYIQKLKQLTNDKRGN